MAEQSNLATNTRLLPRPFQFHWGSGMVIEEAFIQTPYNEPTIQLLEYDDGSLSIRFCYYKGSQFGRGSLLMDAISIEEMREVLQDCPKLKEMLGKMLS